MSVTVRMTTCMFLSLAGCALSPALESGESEASADAGRVGAQPDSTSKQRPESSPLATDGGSSSIDLGSRARVAGDAGVTSAVPAQISQTSVSASADAATTTVSVADAASAEASVGSASSTSAASVVPALAAPVADAPGASTQAVIAPVASAPSAVCTVPAEAALEDVSKPTTVVGTGTAQSCTSSAFVSAVARGGIITFNCGNDPVTITLDQTAKVFNDKAQKVVIDGANKVTLSGGGKVRILYQNTCDESQVWTTSHCDNQEFPQLTVQNLTFADGNAKGTGEGGGAVFAQGGRVKVLNSRFYNNVCDDTGPDLGGGALRVLQQYNGLPAYVVGSTFGGDQAHGNSGANGGALSGLGVSFTVLNSSLSYNRALGNGANPAASGTPGGGSGGAIYNNGNTYALAICGSTLEHNSANEGGGAIFFVSNDRTGQLTIDRSTLDDNKSGKFESAPGMFVQAKSSPAITNSTVK